MVQRSTATNELREAFTLARVTLPTLLILSAVINVLLLAGSFFMLLVYDEVLSSHSVPTLLGLLLMVFLAYVFQAVLELVRARAMIHYAASVDTRLSERIFDILTRYELRFGPMPDGSMPVRDLDMVRGFLASPGPIAILDLPYVLLFLGILFAFHWALGVVALIGLFVLVALMLITSRLIKEPTEQANAVANVRMAYADSTRRNAEVLRALGMGRDSERSWRELSHSLLVTNHRLAEVSGRMQGLSKSFRLFLQSLMLAVGAFLVIKGYATGGIIIAGSILSSRALMPVEQVIANWKGLIGARQAWTRLSRVLQEIPVEIEPMRLPSPSESLQVSNLFAGPPGTRAVTVNNVSFTLRKGEVLGVVGHSGSGKSTLMRALIGAWQPLRGEIRLDGATLDQFDPTELGARLGYVPQGIELFAGSMAQNIARFRPDATPSEVIAAAQAADIHDFILNLPGGYEYQLGPGGGSLSAGQRQRVALARALFGEPFLIVLDEANSNLDRMGEVALAKAIEDARTRGAIVVLVAHRLEIISQVDKILVMSRGFVQHFGEREEVLKLIDGQKPANAIK